MEGCLAVATILFVSGIAAGLLCLAWALLPLTCICLPGLLACAHVPTSSLARGLLFASGVILLQGGFGIGVACGFSPGAIRVDRRSVP